MNIAIFCTTFWDRSPDKAKSECDNINTWSREISKVFPNAYKFLSCGTYSDPLLNTTSLPILSSGADRAKPYDVWNWCYYLCAFDSAMWYAWHNLQRYDVIIGWEYDCWINNQSEVESAMNRFMQSDLLMMAPGWSGNPDVNWIAIKRSGIHRFLHYRHRGNLVESEVKSHLAEEELGYIYRGSWMNPWPEIETIRQECRTESSKPRFDDIYAMKLPMISLPSPNVKRSLLA
jgi:hypothetical protein